jgi:hypothetical protein
MRMERTAQTTWDTRLIVDQDAVTPPGGAPPDSPGISQQQPSLGALQSLTRPSPSEQLDSSLPLEQNMANPQTPDEEGVGMSNLDALIKRRNSSKQNFLGG